MYERPVALEAIVERLSRGQRVSDVDVLHSHVDGDHQSVCSQAAGNARIPKHVDLRAGTEKHLRLAGRIHGDEFVAMRSQFVLDRLDDPHPLL